MRLSDVQHRRDDVEQACGLSANYTHLRTLYTLYTNTSRTAVHLRNMRLGEAQHRWDHAEQAGSLADSDATTLQDGVEQLELRGANVDVVVVRGEVGRRLSGGRECAGDEI